MPNRAGTFGRDLRLRQGEAEQALQLYNSLLLNNRGHIVFIAGEAGSGRSDILQTIQGAFYQAHPYPKIISNHRAAAQEEISIKGVSATTGEALMLGAIALGPAVGPIGEFIGQLLQVGSAARNLAENIAKQGKSLLDSPWYFTDALRREARSGPTICLIDDIDQAGQKWLADMLINFAREVNVDLPILMFLTLDGPPRLDSQEIDQPRWLTVARYLVEQGMAQWWHVKPLSREDIAAWVGPAAPGIVDHLRGATGGNARFVIKLWKDWQWRGVLHYSEKDRQWQWGSLGEPHINLYNDIFESRLKELLKTDDFRILEHARRILVYGAMEGERFTADAIAGVVAMGRNELIDYLDEKLVQDEGRPHGILKEDVSIAIEDDRKNTRTLWTYRFASDLFRYALLRYGLTPKERLGKREMGLALAAALVNAYSPQERQIAKTVARLMRDGGKAEEAATYQRMADYADRHEEVRQHALYVMATKKEAWDKANCSQATELLIYAGFSMLGTYPYEEVLEMFEEACRLAIRTGKRVDQAQALRGCGDAQTLKGEYKAATESLNNALKLYQEIGSRTGEARSLLQLGVIDIRTGNYEQARNKLDQGLGLIQQTDKQTAAAILNRLGRVDFFTGNYDLARSDVERALTIDQQITNLHGIAGNLIALARIDVVIGGYNEAREMLEKALEIARQIDDRDIESAVLDQLGLVDIKTGNYDQAGEKIKRSLEIARQIGDRHGTSMSLCRLGLADIETGNYEQAGANLEEALQIAQQIDYRDGEANCFSGLGMLAEKKGLKVQSLKLFAICYHLHLSIGHGEKEDDYKLLAAKAAALNYSQERLDSLIEEAKDEYQNDRGWGLLSQTFPKE